MFELKMYEKDIRDGATKASIKNDDALTRFILNLAVMRPQFDIFSSEINFRALGQQWNALPSDTRNKQKKEMLELLSKSSKSRMSYE